jgi:hypothetical protein
MRRLFAFASTPFRAVVIITAMLLVFGWLMGYLRLLDESIVILLVAVWIVWTNRINIVEYLFPPGRGK